MSPYFEELGVHFYKKKVHSTEFPAIQYEGYCSYFINGKELYDDSKIIIVRLDIEINNPK